MRVTGGVADVAGVAGMANAGDGTDVEVELGVEVEGVPGVFDVRG